ncbi:MAG: hypothetical protein ACFE9I_09750 [Candidatus Hermodarchaeota archaeon]
MKSKFQKAKIILFLMLILVMPISNCFSMFLNGSPNVVCDLIYDCTLNSDVFDGHLIYTYTDSESYNAEFTIIGGSYDGQHWTWTVDLESRMIHNSNSIYSDYTHDPYIAPKYYLRVGGSLIISMGDHDRIFGVIGKELLYVPNIGNIKTWKCYNSPTNSFIWYAIETYFLVKSDLKVNSGGNTYHLTSILKSAGSLSFLDDDSDPPSIQTTLPTSINPTGIVTRTDGNPGTFSWIVSDQSSFFDLSVYVDGKLIAFLKESGSQMIPNSLGTHIFYIYAEDNDNDRYDDRLWSEKYDYVNIIDDDTSIPQIHIDYNGELTDENPGFWKVSVSDPESGIKKVRVYVDDLLAGSSTGNYNVPNSLGQHEIKVEAWNNDLDRGTIDQETNMISNIISINDDDTTGPIINVQYSGVSLDSDPGQWNVQVSDPESGVDSISILIDGIQSGIIEGNYSVPNIPEDHKIEVSAANADNDREDDQETSYYGPETVTIIDDDITPPEIIINEFDYTTFNWNIKIIENDGIIDSYGTAEYEVKDQNGNIITSGFISEEDIFYTISIPLKIGNYTISIYATNNDQDWIGDEETRYTSKTIKITLNNAYNYVYWQLEELKIYIENNLCSFLAQILNRKLCLAQEQLQKAFNYVENGKITCGLFHDAIAKIMIQIAEFKVEIFGKLDLIDDENVEYIIDSIHSIRDNIVILMGVSTGLEQAYEIANIEIDLLNLVDFIEEKISYCNRWCLNNLLRAAIHKLEKAVFKISMNQDIECILTSAQKQLDQAIWNVDCLLNRGKISQELADVLIYRINQIYTDIELIKITL